MALQQPERGKMEDAVGALEGGAEQVRMSDVAARVEDGDAIVGERGL